MHLNNVQWTSLNNSNCQVTHDFPGGHWIREWESNPQPADPGKNGESPWFDFFRNDDESLILLLNWRMYIFTQAWNCEARTRASPWKQRPQVLVVLSNPFHFIHPSIRCLRWQEEVGRFWAKSSRHVLSLQTIIPGVDMMRDYFSLWFQSAAHLLSKASMRSFNVSTEISANGQRFLFHRWFESFKLLLIVPTVTQTHTYKTHVQSYAFNP